MAFKGFQKGKAVKCSHSFQGRVAHPIMKGLIRFDDSCKIGLKRFLTSHVRWNLPVNGIEIIKDVVELIFVLNLRN